MKKLLLLLLLTSSFFILQLHADNTGQINGTVTDSISGETLVGATIQVMFNGKTLGTITDPEGYYALKPLQPGLYDVSVSYTGYTKKIITGVRVSQETIKILNVQLVGSVGLQEATIIENKYDDLISFDPVIPDKVPSELLEKPTVRGVRNLVATLDGVFQSDTDGELYFRGTRPEATEYYVDNMRVIGELNIPSGAIAEIMVYSGGIPACYGDVTGGVVVITTKSYNMYRNNQ